MTGPLPPGDRDRLVDVTDQRIRGRAPSPKAQGGAGLVGRTYLLGDRTVTVLTGWGPGATVKNVMLQLPDDTKTIRPFRGLHKIPCRKCRKAYATEALPYFDCHTVCMQALDPDWIPNI